MSTFNLPELGEGLEEGEVINWKVKEGESIQADQTIVEVMTDKATIEVPSPRSGKVKKLFYKVGDVAIVGKPLVEIEESGAAAQSAKNAEQTEVVAQAQEKKEATSGSSVSSSSATRPIGVSSSSSSAKALASPAVRKMAREMGVDLGSVQGSGDRGRVLRTDLEGASSGASSSGSRPASVHSLERDERIPFVGIRRKIAESLTKSANTAVHFTHHDEADFTEIMRLRKEANEYAQASKMNVKVTFLPFVIKASIAGLKKFPILNSSLDEKTNEIVLKKDFHFGISTQTDQGLMVSVVRDCDRKNIFELAADINEVVEKARTGKASLNELTGSTITLTSVGNIGGLHATPVINYPEVAIIGMYQIKKRPIVKTVDGEDQIVARPMAYMNITCDHRIVDGAIAAEFMRMTCDYIENPGKLAFY